MEGVPRLNRRMREIPLAEGKALPHRHRVLKRPLSFASDVHISSWPDLQSKLYEDSWQTNLQRFRSPFAFRGLSDVNSTPETTLIRLGGEYPRREQSLLRNFRKYARRDHLQSDSLWHW